MNYRLLFALAFAGAALLAQDTSSQTGQSDQNEQNEPSRYEGPSILSRDRSLIGERSGKLLDYSYYVDVTGAYDKGLIPVSTTSSGALNGSGGVESVSLGYGITGSKTWRRDKLAVDFNGDFRHYPGYSYFDAIDEFVNMSYSHVFNRHLSIQTRDTAGTTSYLNGFFTYLPLQNTDLYAVPTNELFDNRTDFVQSRVDVTWQKSLRLSINFGGEGYLVSRRSSALASVKGYDGHADASYRLTRRQTATLSYQHVAFNYSGNFGNAVMDQFSVGWSIGLGRRWDFATMFGAARANFSGLTTVNLDPAIAAVVGVNTTVEHFDRVSYLPIYQAQIIRRFERASFSAAYNQSFSPGNGVYLASRETAGTAGYSYTGLRRLTFAVNAGYSKLTSLGQTLGNYNGEYAGVGSTYTLKSYAHLELRYDYRHYTTGDITGYKQNAQRISAGLAFSPSPKPLPIW